MERRTKKHLESKFAEFCKVFNLRMAKNHKDNGGFFLNRSDMIPLWSIAQVEEETTNLRHPLGYNFITTNEMYEALDFAIRMAKFQEQR